METYFIWSKLSEDSDVEYFGTNELNSRSQFTSDVQRATHYTLDKAVEVVTKLIECSTGTREYGISVAHIEIENLSAKEAELILLTEKLHNARLKVVELEEEHVTLSKQLNTDVHPEPLDVIVINSANYVQVPEVEGCAGCAFHYSAHHTPCGLPTCVNLTCTGKILKSENQKWTQQSM